MPHRNNNNLTSRDALLEAEATLSFLISSNAAQDPNADVVVKDLVTAAKNKIAHAIDNLDRAEAATPPPSRL